MQSKIKLCEQCISANVVFIYSTVHIGIANIANRYACVSYTVSVVYIVLMCKYNQTTLDKTD